MKKRPIETVQFLFHCIFLCVCYNFCFFFVIKIDLIKLEFRVNLVIQIHQLLMHNNWFRAFFVGSILYLNKNALVNI